MRQLLPPHIKPLTLRHTITRALGIIVMASTLLSACIFEESADMSAAAPDRGEFDGNNLSGNNDNGEPSPEDNNVTAPGVDPVGRFVESNKQRQQEPQLATQQQAQIIEATWRAGLRALPSHLTERGQVAYSPASQLIGLGIALAGAREQTQTQLQQLIAPALDAQTIPAALNWLDQNLTQARRSALSMPQSVWINARTNLSPSYLDLLAEQYGLGVTLVSSSDEASLGLGTWLETQVPFEDEVGSPTLAQDRFAIASAITLNLSWTHGSSLHEDEFSFSDLNGAQRDNEAIELEGQVFEDAQGLRLARIQASDSIEALFVSPPTAQWQAWLTELSREQLEQHRATLMTQRQPGTLITPTFTVESQLDERARHTAQGFGDLFASGRANFATIDGQGKLALSQLLHRVQFSLTRQGIQAQDPDEAPNQLPTDSFGQGPVRLDRPFVVFLRDQETGALLLVTAITTLP